MAINYELFSLPKAIAIYLGKKEGQIDFNKDVILDYDGANILKWNLTEKAEPTMEALITLWDTSRLEYFKAIRREYIGNAFNFVMSKAGSPGCLTTVLDTNGNRIRMDARRSGIDNDLQNYESGVAYLVDLATPTDENPNPDPNPYTPYKDFYDNFHLFNVEMARKIVREVRAYGLGLLNHRWQKIEEINACTTCNAVMEVEW